MNRDTQFQVNRGTAEYPCWENAHWVRSADGPQFHWMKLNNTGEAVLMHESAIRKVASKTSEAEEAIRRLLQHPDLVPDAQKLIEAALEAQSTGKRPALNFWI